MKVVVIGAGALGGQFAAHLARSGTDITVVDTWPEHVAAIHTDGLRVSGAFGDHRVEVPAFTDVAAATGGGLFDAAFVHVDANNTAAAGAAAREALKPAGFALQIQNGLGNVEALQEALGEDRVIVSRADLLTKWRVVNEPKLEVHSSFARALGASMLAIVS